MPKGIVIPADEAEPLRIEEFASLDDYQRVVGGWIEAVNPTDLMATFFVNEEGKLLHSTPCNRRATVLWWGTTPSVRHADYFCGDVVVVGLPDVHGETTDVPAEVIAMLFPEGPFRVMVQVIGEGSSWMGSLARYDTCFEAWSAAFDLRSRWFLVSDIRVVPA